MASEHQDDLLGETWTCDLPSAGPAPSGDEAIARTKETPGDLDGMLAWIDQLTAGLLELEPAREADDDLPMSA